MFESNMDFTIAVCWTNSKVSNRDNDIIVGHLYDVIIDVWCNSVKLHFLNTLKINSSITACSSSMRPIFNKSSQLTSNSDEENCFVVLNVKLQVELRLKTLYWLLKQLNIAFT